MPNNALTTWECMSCKSGGKVKLNTEEGKATKDSSSACKSDDDNVIVTGISTQSSMKNITN